MEEKKFYCLCRGTTMATEVVQFYFRHCGTTAALTADDLAECFQKKIFTYNIKWVPTYIIDISPWIYIHYNNWHFAA